MARKIVNRFLICFVCILLFQSGYAQTNLEKGLLLDKLTNQPISGASVFINASGIGTISASDGRFDLSKFIQAQFGHPVLTIAAMGYETATYNLANSKGAVVIYLNPLVRELQTVTVKAAEKNGWEKYGKDFIESFLSYSDFSKLCTIENPEVLKFYYDRNANALNVIARKPLIIQNMALGYKITYWLESFEHNFSTRILSYSGLTFYEDLIRPNKRKAQAARWILNRETAYEGSVMHFVRSVHAGTLASSGFIVRRLDKVEGNRKGRYNNVLDPKILVEADFSDTIENQKIIQFSKYLYVLYDKELEELPYLIKLQPFKKPIPAPQTSIVQLVGTNAVEIFANGHLEPAISFFLEGYWSYEKLDKLLPLDYKVRN
jgi:CarboxypepD_reg-like domain